MKIILTFVFSQCSNRKKVNGLEIRCRNYASSKRDDGVCTSCRSLLKKKSTRAQEIAAEEMQNNILKQAEEKYEQMFGELNGNFERLLEFNAERLQDAIDETTSFFNRRIAFIKLAREQKKAVILKRMADIKDHAIGKLILGERLAVPEINLDEFKLPVLPKPALHPGEALQAKVNADQQANMNVA